MLEFSLKLTPITIKKLFISLAFILVCQMGYSQLPAFSLSLTAADETCTGNGSLSFNISGGTAGASVFYSIYLLPDAINPLAAVVNNTYTGLSAGNYRVVALQTLGNQSNSQQQDITILDQRTALAIDLVGTPLNCLDGIITVNTISGNPVLYEIVSGPVTVPPQTSNVFNHLPSGTYTLKVTDNCGDALTRAYTLYSIVEPAHLGISDDYYRDCNLVNCNTESITFIMVADDDYALAYPLNVEVTVFPPGGGVPVIISQTVTSGNPEFQNIGFNLPYYEENSFIINIKVTDPCGNSYTKNDFPIFEGLHHFRISPQLPSACYKQINIGACYITPPYTITFLSSPAGFNPSDYNPTNVFQDNYISYTSTPDHEIPDGNYIIKLTDSCGRTFQGQIDVKNSTTKAYLHIPGRYIGCVFTMTVDIPDHYQGIDPQTIAITAAPAAYPHTLPYDVSGYITELANCSMDLTIPGIYTFTGINVCGFPFETTVEIELPEVLEHVRGFNQDGCADNSGSIRIEEEQAPIFATAFIVEAPAGFPYPLPFDVSSYISIQDNIAMNILSIHDLLMPGAYGIVITDICGHTYDVIHATVPHQLSLLPPIVSVLEGCQVGYGSIGITLDVATHTFIEHVTILAAPPGFPYPLPFDASNYISTYAGFYMNGLPQGNYTFHTEDTCGVEHTITGTVAGYHIVQNTATVQGHCGAFDLTVDFNNDIPNQLQQFWLQKYNPVTNQWEHPLSGVPFQAGTFPNTVNSYPLDYNNYNIQSVGSFRIIRTNYIYKDGNPAVFGVQYLACTEIIKEFEFTGSLSITRAYTIGCVSGGSQVFIVAGDNFPLTYKITTRNGLPFLIDNGNSGVFSGLSSGVYNFQVADECGNIVNRVFDLTTLTDPPVTAHNLCNGEDGFLSIQPFGFLNYQWWNTSDPGTILSTTNELYFTPFNNAVTPGTYQVRIYSTSAVSCVDQTITYVVHPLIPPNAGVDNAVTICGNDAPIDLFTILGAPYDTGGYWEESNHLGVISGSVWSPAGIPYGTHILKYTLIDACGVTDDANVTVHYNPALADPVISADPFCKSQTIQLHVDAIPNATYEWTGPNGFTSNLQNPEITNGTAANAGLYTVKEIVDGCESNADMQLSIQPQPDFKLVPACANSNYTIAVKPSNDSFNVLDVSYSWTGPANFTSTDSQIQITGLSPGLYQVTVTNQEGCSETHSIPVSNTRCGIPTVITPNDDEHNDYFDLSGFEVKHIEIFNRWGRMVYKKDNYTKEWHGQNMDNEELPDSTYYYVVALKSGEEKVGWVYKSSWRN